VKKKADVSSLLVFTDGLANYGLTSAADINRALVDPTFAELHYGPKKQGIPNSFNIAQPQYQQNRNILPQQVPAQFQIPQQAPPAYQNIANMPPAYQNIQPQYQQNVIPPQYQQMQVPQQAPPQYQQMQNMQVPQAPPQYQQMQNLPINAAPNILLNATSAPPVIMPNALPCTIHTFGYGSDHDPTLLKAIAEKGNGVYFYVEKPEEIPEAFADCLGGLLSTVAQNIIIKVEVDTGVVIKQLLTKYTTKEVMPGAIYEISLADLQSQEHRDILIMFQIPAVPQAFDEFPVAKVSISYLNVITKQQIDVANVFTLKINRPLKTDPDMPVNFNLDKQYNRIIAAEAMTNADAFANKNKLNEAREILTKAKNRIKESVSSTDEFCKGLVVDLDRCAQGLASREVYQQQGQQQLMNNSVAHFQQRSTNVGWESQQTYKTDARNQMQNFFK